MWERTIEDGDLEARPRGFLLSFPSLNEKADFVSLFIIVTGGASVVIITLKFRLVPLWIEFLQSSWFLRISIYPLIISAVIIICGIIFRTILWFRYKPDVIDASEKVNWPFVSIIMPAFNEEELVGKAIDCIFASNYPQDKMEVIAVNDGSTDTTQFSMTRARRKYGRKLKVISFKRNLGKRKALYAGLKISRGKFVVTVDTDSKIGRNAIRNLVIPLMKDSRVAAVAGRVAVLNEQDNFLTRMLSIRYSISFDFGRAYQSVYGTVFVCPGALSAFRKSVLQPFIRKWVNQKFMKTKCLHGEDRALTTYILKAGYLTKYQSNAIVYTKVPARFHQMNRMYVRWTRSYIRESVLFARFMFSPYRKEHRILPILDFFFLNFLHPFHIFSVALVFYSFFIQPLFILRHLAFLVVLSLFLSLYYLRTNRSLAFLYGVPYALLTAFLLWWIVPYSALTLKNQSWLTK
jgi:hyaluronan synthase